MPTKTQQQIFTELTNSKHIVTEIPDIFDTENNFTEYWHYNTLHKTFPYTPTTPEAITEYIKINLDTKPGKKINLPTSLFLNHHVQYEYKDNKQTNIRLSRFACWCLFKSNPQLLFYSLYFMIPNCTPATLNQATSKFDRIRLRTFVQSMENKLNGILRTLNTNYEAFRHEIFREYYNGFTNKELREIYNLPQKATLADYMNAPSLYGRGIAIYNALEKFSTLPYLQQTDHRLAQILQNELRLARQKIIREYKTLPEKDICKTHIKELNAEYKKLEQDFIKKFAYQSLITKNGKIKQ